MPSERVHDAATTARYATHDQPLTGYGVLAASFLGGAGAFAVWLARSGRPIPDRVELADLALVSIAAHKASRLLAKDRVTSVVRSPFARRRSAATAGEVEDAARGLGLRRAVGELLVCPYCLGMWMAAALTASLLVVPRFTRWIAVVLTAVTIADFLQIAYRKALDTL